MKVLYPAQSTVSASISELDENTQGMYSIQAPGIPILSQKIYRNNRGQISTTQRRLAVQGIIDDKAPHR